MIDMVDRPVKDLWRIFRVMAEFTEGFEELEKAVEAYTPEMAEKITSVPAVDIERAARIYAEAGAASIVYSMGITQHTTGTDNVLSLANLGKHLLVELPEQVFIDLQILTADLAATVYRSSSPIPNATGSWANTRGSCCPG